MRIVLDRAVGAERAPAREAVAESPRDPRRRPDPTGKPAPAGVAQVRPAAIMVRRPGPGLAADPGPAGMRPHPAAVPVRVPGISDRGGHPDDAVLGRLDPAPVPVQALMEIGHRRPGAVVVRRRRRFLIAIPVGGVPVAWARRAGL